MMKTNGALDPNTENGILHSFCSSLRPIKLTDTEQQNYSIASGNLDMYSDSLADQSLEAPVSFSVGGQWIISLVTAAASDAM